jgi:hypothetical protein
LGEGASVPLLGKERLGEVRIPVPLLGKERLGEVKRLRDKTIGLNGNQVNEQNW